MEDRVQRARQRFKDMLASAQAAADQASEERPVGVVLSNAMLSAMKTMNRAGGFLEAVGIVNPELGTELLAEFEAFAAKIEVVEADRGEGGERLVAPTRRAQSERRGWDRRIVHDRRRGAVEVPTERRASSERRSDADRRTGTVRELADRRLRSIRR
jgi:hypothetical protein